jgi:DNA polymerase-1
LIHLDFEFNKVTHEKVNLVCCCVYDELSNTSLDFWLHKSPEEYARLKNYIETNKDRIFVAYGVSAEARSFYALDIDPYYYKWVDQFLEWRCLTNHNDELNWGHQLVNGVVKYVKKPVEKWKQVEGEDNSGFKHTHSLAEATYKLLKEVRDTEHKTKIRDLIISAPEDFTEEEKICILDYCREDVLYLPKMLNKMVLEYKKLLGTDFNKKELLEEMLLRGKYSALTGVRESIGYPIDYKAVLNFSKQVSAILDDCHRDINRQFPDIMPFKYNKPKQSFSWNQIATKLWLQKNVDTKAWMKTEKGQLSLSLDAWQKRYSYSHDYPEGNFPAQMIRFLKLKQSLNGFMPGGKKNFWDAVGPDQRVRPYMNHYGSQTSRSQPGSTSYLLLKPAWQRAMLLPKKGKAITSIDYGSEEYFISALWYNDRNMIDSYLSGDVYLAFAKEAAIVPKNATKESHKYERDLCKRTVLAISYLMSKYGLADALTDDTGKKHTPDEAQEYIDSFYEVYGDFKQGMEDFYNDYLQGGFAKLSDGWYLWGGNDNKRSVSNWPIQGLGAVIMRKADMLCYEKGLKVVCTLHDALYIEHDWDDLSAVDTLRECMLEAFASEFPHDYETAKQIRLDPFTWGPDYPAPKIEIDSKGKNKRIYETRVTPGGMEIEVGDLYADERAITDYEKFSKYFYDREEDEL